MNRICNICNIRRDENNYLNDRTVCRNCYNTNRRKNNKITLIQTEQPKSDNDKKQRKVVNSVDKTNNNKKKREVVDYVNINNNRTLIIGFSICGKTYLMSLILFRKQEPIFIITKSLNQYPNIKAQTSVEIQPLNEYENSFVVFDDMLLSKQESKIDLLFTRGRHNNNDIYYISQNYFDLPKKTIRNNSNINILFKQTLRDIILLIHNITGLDRNLEEWKQLCRKAWENDYEYLQINRFDQIGNGRYIIRNCNKNVYIECTSETKRF